LEVKYAIATYLITGGACEAEAQIADALTVSQHVAEGSVALGAVRLIPEECAVEANCLAQGHARPVREVGIKLSAAVVLAKISSQIEKVVRRRTLPCLHIKQRGGGLTKATVVVYRPRWQHRNPKRRTICRISKLPAVIEPTLSTCSLKTVKTHNKIIHELLGNSFEAS